MQGLRCWCGWRPAATDAQALSEFFDVNICSVAGAIFSFLKAAFHRNSLHCNTRHAGQLSDAAPALAAW
jgi:hypothetical protein